MKNNVIQINNFTANENKKQVKFYYAFNYHFWLEDRLKAVKGNKVKSLIIKMSNLDKYNGEKCIRLNKNSNKFNIFGTKIILNEKYVTKVIL